ncbi:MAG: PqqD family protein [Bacteroidetes bacterium]|nr:PqqD family protein [Bacteroidota bacterium]MBL7104552.1 PqqD family protein [Bacteroidales bacterium]
MMKIKKNIATSESGYVFNPSTGESFSVNPIAIEIFNFLKEGKSYEEISKTMLARYNTDEATFEKDYNDFMGMLKQHLLIETENEKEN